MRASAAVSQLITGSFQISGSCRRDRRGRPTASSIMPLEPGSARTSGARIPGRFPCRIPRPTATNASAPQQHSWESPQPHTPMSMKDGYAPIIVVGSTSRFLEKCMGSTRPGPGIATHGYASLEIPGKVKAGNRDWLSVHIYADDALRRPRCTSDR